MNEQKYRVRKGLFGRCILQKQTNSPAYLAGRVDSSLRVYAWIDVKWSSAPTELKEVR